MCSNQFFGDPSSSPCRLPPPSPILNPENIQFDGGDEDTEDMALGGAVWGRRNATAGFWGIGIGKLVVDSILFFRIL